MVCKTPSIALDSEEFKEARDAWLKEKRGERKMKQGDRGCKEWVEMTIADKSARKLLELQESVPEQNTLKQMLNKAGYKEHSSINPLILQSKILEIVKEWLQEHIMQPEVTINYEFRCPYCNKVFKGSKKSFDECFKHMTTDCKEAYNANPYYPLNYCTKTQNGLTRHYLP